MPQAAVALSLVLHELTTNARKYGALFIPEGRLRLQWEVLEAKQVLELEWTETDGPAVHARTKRGFGTMLIERSLNGVGGSTTTRFEPSGLACSIRLPLAPNENIAATAK